MRAPNPNPAPRRHVPRAVRRLAPLVLVPLVLAGCLGRPGIVDRWTRIDLLGANVQNMQTVTPGARDSIAVSADIYYRAIVTGYCVAELRVSGTVPPGAVDIAPDAPRDVMAGDIDNVLAHSVSVGRAIRPITGWDHLIQHLDLSFAGVVPGVMTDSLAPSGAPVGAFLLVYLGSGDKIERLDGSDTVIVTPFNSTAYQILPIGVSLALPGAGPAASR